MRVHIMCMCTYVCVCVYVCMYVCMYPVNKNTLGGKKWRSQEKLLQRLKGLIWDCGQVSLFISCMQSEYTVGLKSEANQKL